ncbi:pyruvate dehydrogenase E2 component (dihydrolipoamide acetyltransferase) [Natronincola peptidivorans]|uniref:Dihydrolipoamide acetyltransferase component of pyruvate dehydrogenase complex n=1 Tax=Natronincola peptidivorans TaxID=426128 RepID=A0A1I0BLE0_9FIRM|nr:dihydrolipoamide acetyltransferase family protein [Natronincola peptidivorans]SET07814.1 pyruvate dehydrogenase E2 component (dihydrolipoamide acetyltransferase) [Natronincola peptidivorans]
MATLIQMPKLGLTMVEGTITNWLKKEGDYVEKGEALFEVSTDKISNEVNSTVGGVLRKIFVQEGQVCEVKKNVAIIGEENEDISNYLGEDIEDNEENTKNEAVVEKSTAVVSTGDIKASPLAKKIARDNGLDLSIITGTGPKGRIVERDVLAHMEASTKKVKASPMAVKTAEELQVDLTEIHKDTRIMKADVYNFVKEQSTIAFGKQEEKRVAMNQMRKVIANRMHQSWTTAPAVTYNLKADVTNLKELKEQLSNEQKVTYTDLLVKIVARALIEFPYLNSSIENDEIILRNYANVGVAVALEEGLVVPVVKLADSKGLKEISTEVKELAEKARSNELTEDDYTGGTFTITNLGMFGMESFTPIINPPEVGILGINNIIDTPMVIDGKVVIKPMMNLSLTADHRVVDGAVGAQFLARVKEYIEKPGKLLL